MSEHQVIILKFFKKILYTIWLFDTLFTELYAKHFFVMCTKYTCIFRDTIYFVSISDHTGGFYVKELSKNYTAIDIIVYNLTLLIVYKPQFTC